MLFNKWLNSGTIIVCVFEMFTIEGEPTARLGNWQQEPSRFYEKWLVIYHQIWEAY